MSLKDEIEAMVDPDPVRAVRLCHAMLLIQSVGAILSAGGSPEDLRETFEEAITQSLTAMGQVATTSKLIIGH
jgi:hypothetical protein